MISYKKYKGFSLVEAMIAMLVVGLIFVMVAPFIMKKVKIENGGKVSKGYYFQHALGPKDRCFVTKHVTHNGLNDQIIIEQSESCQEYMFVVPGNVSAIDLTLVAGGGGGGGASGGTVFENNIVSNKSKAISDSVLVNLDTLKHIYIDYMIGRGQNGSSASTTTGKAGSGGYSGHAIVDYTMPRELVYNWLFKTPMDFFVKNDPASDGDDYNPVDRNKMTENYKRFYAKFGYNSSDSDTYLDFLRYGKLGDTKLCQDSNVNDTDSCMSAKLITKDGGTSNSFDCITRSGLEDEDTTKCYADISETASLISRQAPVNSQASYKGSDMTTEPDKEQMHNSQLQGTLGGSVVQAGTCGVGGKGGYLYTEANGGSVKTTAGSGELGSDGCGSVIVATEYAGQSGAGGVGGAAITFKNFPVTPGSAYRIYVGKGGAGGASGISGLLLNKDRNTETAGHAGVGGASVAIYDEDDNLVVMVLGGVGGAGGNIKTPKQDLLTNSPNPEDIIPNQITSTRQYPILIVGKEYLDQDDKVTRFGTIKDSIHDDHVTIFTNSNAAGNQLSADTGKAFRIEYNYADTKTVKNEADENVEQLIQSKEAVRLLNLDNSKIYTKNTSTVNFNNTADDDKRTGGFSRYARLVSGAANFDNNIYSSTIKVRNTTYTNIYNGFYARYLDETDYMYAGGLGGFSGLGTKAGCGGGFVGNKEGKTKTSGTNNAIFENTFIVGRSNTNEANKLNAFNVNEYYDGCSLDSPDGQSAEFIKPAVSSIDGEIKGQAGSGGGGGGWSTKYGAGKGGDGQNGYVFMTWKK